MIYYVLLETVTPIVLGNRQSFRVGDRKVVELEAENLDNAWDKARARWYEENMADIQIVDIVVNKPEPEPVKELEDDQRDQEASGDEDSGTGKGNGHDTGGKVSGTGSDTAGSKGG